MRSYHLPASAYLLVFQTDRPAITFYRAFSAYVVAESGDGSWTQQSKEARQAVNALNLPEVMDFIGHDCTRAPAAPFPDTKGAAVAIAFKTRPRLGQVEALIDRAVRFCSDPGPGQKPFRILRVDLIHREVQVKDRDLTSYAIRPTIPESTAT